MTAMIVAMIATSSEIGNRVAISTMTGLPDHIELPRSKRDQAPQEIEKLQDPGPVDADFGVAGGERRGREAGAAGAQPHQADIARDQAHQHENQRRRPEQGREDQQEPADDVAVHRFARVSPAAPAAAAALYLSSQTVARSWLM